MQLVNLTPHLLNLVAAEGYTVKVPPTSPPARLAVTRDARPPITVENVAGYGDLTMPVVRPTLGEIQDLPAPVEGTVYVVSALVAEAAKRPDVMSPGELLRDETGNIIGARGLCTYA